MVTTPTRAEIRAGTEQAGGHSQALETLDSTRVYRREIGRIDVLSIDEVRSLAQRIEAGRDERLKAKPDWRIIEEGEEARRILIESNLRFVWRVARSYRGLGVDFLDLLQEGNLGLIHAVEKFDYRRENRFSTYAVWWIRQSITQALAEMANTIHVPSDTVAALKRLKRVYRQLAQRLEGEPTLEDLAGEMEISVQQVIRLLTTRPETLSLDESHQSRDGDEESTLLDRVEDDPKYRPDEELATQSLSDQLRYLLDTCLEPKERQVLELRYGLGSGHQMSLAALLAMSETDVPLDDGKELGLVEAGQRLGMSHETVRQTEFRALRKLLDPSRELGLEAYLRE
jgi:RNA polymerase primary sigma factor